MKGTPQCKSVKFTFPSLKTRGGYGRRLGNEQAERKREQRKPNEWEKAMVLEDFHFQWSWFHTEREMYCAIEAFPAHGI